MEELTAVEAKGAAQEIHHNAQLTSSELAGLWMANAYYTMLRCVYKHLLNTLDDRDLYHPLENGLSICETRVNKTCDILKMEGHLTPKGFGDEDVDLEAPRLFTDLFYYYYIHNLARLGMLQGSMNLTFSTRKDIRDYYTEAVTSTMRYYNRVSEIMLEKGIYVRPPVTNTYKGPDEVKKQNFLRGFLGERRPLLAEEINQLFFGIWNNTIGGALTTGFQQVARSEQVRRYMSRGSQITRKHVDIFSTALQEENLPVPMHSGELVTNSKIPPFSDKLMMHHVVVLTQVGIGNYAAAMASSLRHDLSADYLRLMGEAANYGEDGLNILIENGWFEEPPRKTDPRDVAEEPVH